VDQPGFFIEKLDALHGIIQKLFLKNVGYDHIWDISGRFANTCVIDRTFIGYCDGLSIHEFQE
jgi:hypothetical protein